MTRRRLLVFISTRFLFPLDSGGKIRTTQILRGMKGGPYEIALFSPAAAGASERHQDDLRQVCDRFESWPEARNGRWSKIVAVRHLPGRLPIPVRTDWSAAGARLIERALDEGPDVVVFDFLHAGVLAPEALSVPSVLFTHNVEAEIFARHAEQFSNPALRWLWRNQHRKMQAYERQAMKRFDVVVAVSDRDAETFRRNYGLDGAHVIPTGVDLEFFEYHAPKREHEIVFCGSMDWLANQDAVYYFMDDVWPLIIKRHPEARMTVVGRAPPQKLVRRARSRGLNWTFTGFVDDVRPHMRGAAVSVIPLRIGGGTRLKAYEAMAMGSPLVSTSIGVEGLPVEDGEHYLMADSAESFASAVLALMKDRERRERIARAARTLVDANFSFRVAATVFAQGCDRAIEKARIR